MIGIVIAVKREFEIMSKYWGEFKKIESNRYNIYNNREVYTGRIADREVIVVISGVGKVNAASATQWLCNFVVDKIINIGVCGATGEAYKSEATAVISRVLDYDFDTSAVDGENAEKHEIDLSAYTSQPTSKYPLFTQDHFVIKAKEEGYYEMEGYAVARVAEINEIPCTIIKSVTDIISTESQDKQYYDNIKDAYKKAAEKLSSIINTL